MSSRALSELVKNNTLYPLFVFCLRFFWGGGVVVFFHQKLTPTDGILLQAIYYISTNIFEVTTAYQSDQLGRRVTLLFLSYLRGCLCCICAR